jgi:hypothetical protein
LRLNAFAVKLKTMKRFFFLLFVLQSVTQVFSQTNGKTDTAYIRTITQRADKIVATLGLTDDAKYKSAREIIASQYISLREIHDGRNTKVKAIKADSTKSKADKDTMIKKLETEANIQLKKLHGEYLTKLSKDLTPEQIEKVKDGMTFGKVQFTYGGYLQMIPTLTDAQKKQIMDWLLEARELAMDGESSEKKTAIFGKYKGRIANYLSKEGYDLKKEQVEWNKRINEAKSDTTKSK